ncbi:MAG: AMP-binding protein [Sphingomonadales bacterium]|nr:AMP-binding protein [Sphingomonadales bacterium]
MTENLVAIFYARQTGQAEKPAIVWKGEPLYTFGALPAEVGRYRAALAGLGVKRGDRVMVKAESSPQFVLTYLAVLAAGAIFVPMNAAYTAAEVALLIEDAEPVLLVHAEGTAVPEAPADLRRVTLNADGTGTLVALAEAASPDLSVEDMAASDLAAILFTSGTTGRPKGAMLTHGNLASNVAALFETWRFSSEDTILHTLPLFHAHGLFVCLHLGLYSGATLRMLPKFDAARVIADLPRVTVFMGVPTFYTRLLESEGFTREASAGLRLFISGSAPLLPSVFGAFEARTGHRILERYGMTETVMITSNPYDQAGRIPGTVGFPLPGVSVRVVDGERQDMPVGEVGEIEMKGPNQCAGYWRRPEATAESFFADGYFRTGDTGFLDSEGRLTISGRSKDLIISGGYNVYPAEIEMLLADVAGVQDVAVFGVPHPDFGEAVMAAITIDPTTGDAFDMAAMQSLITTRLAKFKQPKAVEVLEAFPRNAMGKILKQELRDRYRDTFARKA